MTDKNNSSYTRILKTSSILGASSLIDILLRIIRTKVLAIYLGPAYFGVMTLYYGLIDMIMSITSLGLGQSAVRDIAKASATNDLNRVALVTIVLRRIVWATGFLGLFVTLGVAYPASWQMFGDTEHIWAIALLGVVALFSQIRAGQMALLSGLRLISEVAKANVLGSFLGTLLAIPLIIWLSEHGIIPFIIVIAFSQLVASWWYARKKHLPDINVNWRQTIKESSGMMRLGIVLMVSSVSLAVSSYAIRLILQNDLGEASVGLYQAAFTVSGIYIGFLLQAMSGDFFPHLTAIGEDRRARNKLVNEQLDIALLIAVPGLVALLLFSDILLWALYSDRFIGGSEVLKWQVLGMFGRIISWPMGFILLARADKTAFISSEIAVSLAHVLFVWWGVRLYGIEGAGIAFALQYIMHIFLMIGITKTRHQYRFEHKTLIFVLSGTVLILLAFSSTFVTDYIIRYFVGGVLLLCSIYWSTKGFIPIFGRDKFQAKYYAALEKIGLRKQ